ncbi:conserved hypothetical protein [Leishmania infantum JPCM5]|uniref:Guanine nucleotide-binding protein-like 3 N-terminal domain-containing protein n=3 Tax=Leishmania donovani species complex TaxID=38574 RepID=A4HY46_LEIIN|nr:conserved hypothetical protein [Leishmania infantum JPCM5]XP_003860202.1 hypothetical protein, conserved [Leishmania donovani]CAC9482378.1 GNL3L/Grn1_putative_GTPase_-_putative [Leishmania infantum]AYU78121.1 GNL3L/Grn1 putative GTPase, putative [Leishmania donovani]TPP51044.1 GNL3L/Grn1 putative GTPase family protein [Leishmania donovani]CAM67229.1 conserved hypothetical protein [Leishmania infantum JPCM5]CBZ33495.1 hypothetical protein, conserved [Leishmania donovani]|eukprot:XP_001464987.1 conserved hypothetical protein [Leishmania infantum JPCM5]
MVKVKASKSKRMSSKQRHKIDRKKREHKRDLKKAAKALKKTGMAPKRSKKSRDMAKLALQVSNRHPDKEQILSHVLQARETARVMKAERRARKGTDAETDGGEENQTVRVGACASNRRQLLYISAKDSNHFRVQFNRALTELIFPAAATAEVSADAPTLELPAAAYVVTLDARFAVQSMPWTLLDAIIDQAADYTGGRKVLLLFTLTKADVVSAPAMVSQLALVAFALQQRYPKGLGANIVATVTPFSVHSERTQRQFLRVLNQFRQNEGCSSKKMASNLTGKICAFVIGLPNTGRRTLCRTLSREANESGVSTVPLRAAQLQLIRSGLTEEEEKVHTKFAMPNAKAVTLVQLPEDAGMMKELHAPVGGDVLFRSLAFVERAPEPEAMGCVLFDGVADKTTMAQAFCVPAVGGAEGDEKKPLKVAEKFLRELGRAVRRDGGFHVSPLFASDAGTMGKVTSSGLTGHGGFNSGQQCSQSTLLNVTYSNATPSKLVHISTVMKKGKGKASRYQKVSRADAHNALRLGARTFLREMSEGRHVPWAVMRAPGDVTLTPAQVGAASEIFSVAAAEGKRLAGTDELKGTDHLNALVDVLATAVRDIAVILPNGVVEMSPDFLTPPQYKLEKDEATVEETDEDDVEEAAGEQGGSDAEESCEEAAEGSEEIDLEDDEES